MKIKVSFTTEAELDALLRFLSPVIKSYKVAKEQKGQYKRAYIDIIDHIEDNIEEGNGYAGIQGQSDREMVR